MPRRVVIVEDEPEIAELVAEVLRDQGYRALCCDGATALARMGEARPDVVVLDLMMAPVSGWDVARAMREHPALGDVPVVVASAAARIKEAAENRSTRWSLPKPFDLTDPLEVVQRAAVLAARPY